VLHKNSFQFSLHNQHIVVCESLSRYVSNQYKVLVKKATRIPIGWRTYPNIDWRILPNI